MSSLKTCDTCGNHYDKTFDVIKNGRAYTFDSLECAAKLIAPKCSHCECTILGHGIEIDNKMFCCAHCSRMDGFVGAKDRVNSTLQQKSNDMIYEGSVP